MATEPMLVASLTMAETLVLAEPVPILLNGLRVGTNGGTQIVNVVVQAIDKPEALRGGFDPVGIAERVASLS